MSQQLQRVVRDADPEEGLQPVDYALPLSEEPEGSENPGGGDTGRFLELAARSTAGMTAGMTAEVAAIDAAVPQLSIEYAFKRVLDLLGSLVLAIVFTPLILAIVLLMHRHGGKVIYKHRRVGVGGELFECLKFRTMVPNADRVLQDLLDADPERRAEWLRDQKLRDDPRVTAMGKFLRRTSLDELPQLWNVVKGEMSLVGPRPITRQELLRYGRNMVLYMMVKPGITGLWQVSGRSNTDYRRRVAMDVCYIRKQSVLFDLWILLKTTLVVLGRRGAY